jgi:membrane protease YdiL (CAAX protease family)
MIDSNQPTSPAPYIKNEALWALIYYAVYLVYLFFSLENEFLHWLTMVLIPFGFFYMYQTKKLGSRSIKSTLSSFGLEKTRLLNGLHWAILLGLVLSFLQRYFSRNNDQIAFLFRSGKFAYLFPMALVLMLFTAGFTEEFFFRGVLQTRLQQMFPSKIIAVIVTSVLFGIYHLPYAYLNPRWPSYGNLSEAFSSALGQGIPMGLILGAVYVRTKNNLLACIVVHSLLNSLPAMLAIKFQSP